MQSAILKLQIQRAEGGNLGSNDGVGTPFICERNLAWVKFNMVESSASARLEQGNMRVPSLPNQGCLWQ